MCNAEVTQGFKAEPRVSQARRAGLNPTPWPPERKGGELDKEQSRLARTSFLDRKPTTLTQI